MQNKILFFYLAIGLLGLGQSSAAVAHARFKVNSKVTPPRDNSTGLKTAPCGGVVRTASSVTFKPGAAITVEFEETINHLGYFEIYFMTANDSTAGTPLPLATVQDSQNDTVASGVNHQFTANVTLPNISCEQCTLQLVQVMQDQGPTGPKTYYYSCSDIRLSNNPAPPAPPPPPVTPAPSPPPPATPTPGPAPGSTPGSPPIPKAPPPPGPGETPAPSSTDPAGQKPAKPGNLKLEKQAAKP